MKRHFREPIVTPDPERGEPLTESQKRELKKALEEADAGEGVDGWQFLKELASMGGGALPV